MIATLPYDEDVADARLVGESPVRASERLRTAAGDIVGAFRTTTDEGGATRSTETATTT